MSSPTLRASACALFLAVSTAALAQQSGDSTVPPAAAQKQASEIARGDPARWSSEDLTEQDRLRTLQKEIHAAYAEAKAACRALPEAERAACLKQARATWEQDLASARQQLDAAPRSSVRPKP